MHCHDLLEGRKKQMSVTADQILDFPVLENKQKNPLVEIKTV